MVGLVGRFLLPKFLLSAEIHRLLHVHRSRSTSGLYLSPVDTLSLQSCLLAGVPVRSTGAARPGLLLPADWASSAVISDRMLWVYLCPTCRLHVQGDLLSMCGGTIASNDGTMFFHDFRQMQDILPVS